MYNIGSELIFFTVRESFVREIKKNVGTLSLQSCVRTVCEFTV